MASSSASSSSTAVPLEKCPICLSELSVASENQRLECGHWFHRSCIHGMRDHGCAGRCPVCRGNDAETFSSFNGCNDFEDATRYLFRAHRNIEERAALLHKAEALFREFLEVDPTHFEALCNFGMTLQMQGDLEGAIEKYKQALGVRPKHLDSLINLGHCFKKKGEWQDAITQYTSVLRALPSHLRQPHIVDGVRFNLGVCFFNMGELSEAIPHFLQVLEINPGHAPALCYLGMAYKRQGHIDDAIHHYRKALDVNPQDADAHYCLGNALLDKGCIDGAIAEYEKTLNCDPHHPGARNNLRALKARIEFGDSHDG